MGSRAHCSPAYFRLKYHKTARRTPTPDDWVTFNAKHSGEYFTRANSPGPSYMFRRLRTRSCCDE